MRHKQLYLTSMSSLYIPPQISDLSFPEDYSLFTTGITQSLLSTWQKCPRAFLISLNRWTDPTKGKRTGFGSLFHQMLDNLYSYYSETEDIPDKDLIKDWIQEYADNEESKRGHGSLSGKQEEEIERDKLVTLILLEEYIKFYPKDFKKKKFDEIEKSFEVQFHGYKLKGKIDARYWLSDERWLMEHKTKSRFNWPELVLKLSFDLQNLFYILADELENKHKVQGVLYNVVRNPSDPWRKKYPTIREYGRFLRVKIRKNPDHYFLRKEIIYSEEDKKNFRTNLLNKLRLINRMINGTVPIYPNESSCLTQYTCDNLRACSAGCLIGYEQKESLMTELKPDPKQKGIKK
jgi:hypothetical protein